MNCLFSLLFYDILNDGILIRVRLSPNSSSCRFGGVFFDSEGLPFLKVAVVSVPEKGKANKELVQYFSKVLGVAKSFIEIVSGEFDRYKKIKILGHPQELSLKIEKWIKEGKHDSSDY